MNQSKFSSLVFGIPVRLLGEVGDDLLEVARDVADGDVFFRQLVLKALHFRGKSLRQRLDRFVLGFLDELTLARNYVIDHGEERRGTLVAESQVLPDPLAQIGRGTGESLSVSRLGRRWAMAMAERTIKLCADVVGLHSTGIPAPGTAGPQLDPFQGISLQLFGNCRVPVCTRMTPNQR